MMRASGIITPVLALGISFSEEAPSPNVFRMFREYYYWQFATGLHRSWVGLTRLVSIPKQRQRTTCGRRIFAHQTYNV